MAVPGHLITPSCRLNTKHFLLDIGKGKLTVGKIYGGLLILENWKQTKFGHMASSQKVTRTLALAKMHAVHRFL